MTHQTVNIRLPPELHRRLAAMAAEGILGRTIEEVVIHLTRNALHRDWGPQPEALEKPRPSNVNARLGNAPKRTDPTPDLEYATGKRLLRLPEVIRFVGLSRSTIYGMVHVGTFPATKKLGERSVAWFQSDVESWIDTKD